MRRLDELPPTRRERRLTRTDVMTTADVASLLGCSRRHVYDLAHRGELPGARHIGRTLIVVRPVLETWLMTGALPADHAGT